MKCLAIASSFLLLAITACSSATESVQSLKITISPDATDRTAALVKTYADQLPKACPGLVKFAADLSGTGTQNDGYDGASATIVIKVADRPTLREIYQLKAQGNNCYFGIVDGPNPVVRLAKHACQSICLGREVPHSGDESAFARSLR